MDVGWHLGRDQYAAAGTRPARAWASGGTFPRIRKIIADQRYKQQFFVWFLTTLQWIVEIVQRNPHVKGFDVLPK